MRVADKVFKTLNKLGSNYAAGVAGGGIMFLVDALKKNKDFQLQFFHHEQSAAFAAEAYARCTQSLPVCFATIGPGVTNIVSGAFSCFINSVPCFFVTGAKRSNVSTDYSLERFSFPQDCNTEAVARGVVKKFHELKHEDDVERIVTDLAIEAISNRPGPVWLSIPLDVQSSIAVDGSGSSKVSGNSPIKKHFLSTLSEPAIQQLCLALAKSSKPILILGHGLEKVFLSCQFREFLRECYLPVATSIGANHLIVSAGDSAVGFFGPTGRRAANYALVEADLIIGLGFRFTSDVIGFNQEAFFGDRHVFALVDDPAFRLPPSVSGEIFVFLPEEIPFGKIIEVTKSQKDKFNPWCTYIQDVKSILTDDREIQSNKHGSKVDPYYLGDVLLKHLQEGSGIAGGIALEITALSHSMSFKNGHEFYLSSHAGQLGWDLPAAIGLAHSGRYRSVVCITGDGSIMFNLQELATLSKVDCGVTIFVIDNSGYNSIRTTQDTHLGGVYAGSTLEDLTFPDWQYIAKAFGFTWVRINRDDDLDTFFSTWNQTGKIFVQIVVDPDRGRTPRLVSKIKNGSFETPRLDNQYPPLPDDVIEALQRAKNRLYHA